MAKLYFKYGAMGSSKSAQALITKFNYEELGMTVWLIKPSIDTRDGADLIRSRIGLSCHARVITPDESIIAAYRKAGRHDVIIADEAQFFTPEQIDELRTLVDDDDLPVLCFGLRTDFLTHFFPGARRLMELADSLTEIKTVCACGRKATAHHHRGRPGLPRRQRQLCRHVPPVLEAEDPRAEPSQRSLKRRMYRKHAGNQKPQLFRRRGRESERNPPESESAD